MAESGDVRSPVACIARRTRACRWESGRRFPGRFLAGKAVGELAAIVGEQPDDGDRTGFFELDQEVGAAVGLVGIDLHEDPARGAVDGDEQIMAFGFIGHLRQVLDIHM